MPAELTGTPPLIRTTDLGAAVDAVRVAIKRLDKAVIELESFPQVAELLEMNDREMAAVISRYRAQLDDAFPQAA